jgi:hypothetical protein
MDFKIWFEKKIKKRLSSKVVTELRSKVDSKQNEDKEEYLEVEPSQEIRQIEDQLPSVVASKQTPLSSKSVITTHGDNREKISYNDYLLDVLNDLPEQWIGKEMKLHIIADKSDAVWIIRRVFEDIQRGLINAQLTVKESNHLCEISFVLKIADGLVSFPAAVTAINPVFSFILTDIKSEAILRRKRRIKNTIM